ncbi:MAG TPA: hypothetical protein VFA09_21060 [Ktedonobacteraceae bacterium]|nr:hypothetical protein [Ktedonobacteraceae bacterium]
MSQGLSRSSASSYDHGPSRRMASTSPRRLLLSALLGLLLLSGVLGNWAASAPAADAAVKPPRAIPGHLTLQQFLHEQQNRSIYHGPFQFPKNPPSLKLAKGEHLADYQHLPPSAEPPTMKPLRQVLDRAFLVGNPPGHTPQPLDLLSSDQRLELQIQPATFDLSHATTSKGVPANKDTSLILTITENHGYFLGQLDTLGEYSVLLTDAHNNPVQGIQLQHPISILYHYDPQVIAQMGLDPAQLFLSWPALASAARTNHQSLRPYLIALQDNPKTHTLSGQTTVIANSPFDEGGGNTDNASPPVPLLGTMQGNSGQFVYSYPLTVAPGPLGTVPQLLLTYSSAATNGRHNRASPADDFGEGWSLSLGAITADEYRNNGGTWYSISGVDHVSDLLVPNPKSPTNFLTEHISQLKIEQVTVNGQPCFDVWDTSGTEFIFGCTADSLQYNTDSSGTRHNYAWDLDQVIPANEGPGTSGRFLSVTYEQDKTTPYGYTTIRDAVIKQITYGTGSTISGTVDFSYQGPYDDGSWVHAYSGSCKPLRCDDPVDFPSPGLPAPKVMATFTPLSITSYVGTDSPGNQDYSYSFSFGGSGYSSCWDDWTQLQMYCAGEHLLESITPTVYQHGTGTQLKGLVVGYSGALRDDYYDSTQQIPGHPGDYYNVQTYWQYVTSYDNLASGTGGSVAYLEAYNNTHGTPDAHSDNRFDPMYCSLYPSDCTGSYAWPDDRAWAVQSVTSITVNGTDSSSSSLAPAITTYHYQLAETGQSGCNGVCVGDNWIPPSDNDFLDYYHSEFRGFAYVDITSPSNDLTVQQYASTDGWGTQEGFPHNYTSGALDYQYVYQGNSSSGPLLQETENIYAGYPWWDNSNTANSCNGNYSGIYTPCEVMIISSRTTQYEGTSPSNPNAPWVEQDSTFDDYRNSSGLGDFHQSPALGSYHNLQQQTIAGPYLSPAYPSVYLTRKWTYQTNDTTIDGWVYYDVNKVAHSEIDDSVGDILACQSFSYDENAAQGVHTPAAGFLTTVNWYQQSACTSPNFGTPQLTTYAGYDTSGNQLMTVDAFGTAHASFYGSGGTSNKNGCTLSGAPAIYNTTWNAGTYTTCTIYDGTSNLPTSSTNAFGQTTSIAYDPGQGDLPTSETDVNHQVTALTYTYDQYGNLTVQTTEPNEQQFSYTEQATSYSTCSQSSRLPCAETKSNAALYPSAVAETFYDAHGRVTETRTPGPDSADDTIQFTVYNDQQHSSFTSIPFEVASGTGWIDPNGATDKNGHTPTGTATFYDAMGRVIAVQDPLFNPPGVPGISCPSLGGNATTCAIYELDTVNGDSNTYDATVSIDADNHASESLRDVLGETRYVRYDSGTYGGILTPNELIATQFNVLGEPLQVTTTDLLPQSGQILTSATVSMQYDNLGRLTQLLDPDAGTHTYTYDADSRLTSDVAGSQTLGYNYDLLGRLGCLQDAVPPTSANATGACSGGNPLIQNTYDSSVIGGSSDYPVGQLTKSVATTYFPEGGSATATEKFAHDQRGRLFQENLVFSLPNSWGVSTALPTYKLSETYTDADQSQTTTTSSASPSGLGFTSTQIYDPTNGGLLGMSNNTNTTTPNLASITYNVNALVGSIALQTSTGSALATEQYGYDGDLRPTSMTATWQGGSGQSGTIYSQGIGYDPTSNVTSSTTTQAGVPGYSNSGGSETQVFCYDEQNRLTWSGNTGTPSCTGNGTPGVSGNIAAYINTFVYTHLGQLWQGPLNGGSTQYQYLYCTSNAPHQLSGLYAMGSTCTNKTGQGYATSYDPSTGNVKTRSFSGTTGTLSYNNLNEMVEWNAGSTNQEWYIYDASGNRVLRRSTNSSSTTMTVYPFGLEEHVYSGSGSNQFNTYY